VFQRHGVIEIGMDEAICTGTTCRLTDGHNTLFSDGNHVSAYAARTVYAPFLHDRLFGPDTPLLRRGLE
jgi:hypothetical protein